MILVTGGTGLVGSHLLYKLTLNDDKIIAIYRSEHKLEKVKTVFSYYTSDVDTSFNKFLSSDFPEGSPIIPVAPPTKAIG